MNTLNLSAPITAPWRSLLPYTADKRWQRAFSRYHDIVNHMAMRWGMFSGALLWILGAVLGMLLRPWNTEALLQCLGIAVPFYIAVGMAVGNPHFRGHYQWLAALGNLTSGLLLFPVAAKLPEPELTMLVGLIIITFHAVAGLRLRVIYALPVMLVYNGLFVERLWRVDTIGPETTVVITSLVCIAFIGAVIAAIVLEANIWALFRRRSAQQKRQHRPDLRLSALPEDVAHRWQKHPGLVLDEAEPTQVLVARVAPERTGSCTSADALAALHSLFARFDALAQRRGLERVRMSGGEFVVAASDPVDRQDRGHAMAELALAMMHVAEEVMEQQCWSLRISLDKGLASRGAIGSLRPAYEIIGPAIEGASALLEGTPEGCILMSERFHVMVRDRFETQQCGTAPGGADPAFLLWGVKVRRERGALQALRSASRIAFLPTLMAMALPSSAQWERIAALPASDTPSLLVHEGTLYAGTDSTVWRSDDGADWQRGATLPDPGYFVDVLFHDGSTLFAGTGGNGLFVSPIDGITWQHFSQGLTSLGSTYIADVATFDNDLWCATVGGGVFRRTGAAWEPFGDLHEMNAGNVAMLRAIGDTLWAGAGGNGYIWRTMPGMDQFEAKLVAPVEWDMHAITDAIQVGAALLAGGTYGIFRSVDGGDTWTWSSTGLPGGANIRFIATANALYALRNAASSRLYRSLDEGATWQLVEHLPICYAIAAHQGRLYAGRTDGLWVRDLSTSIGEQPANLPDPLILFPNPSHDIVQVHMAFQGQVVIELIDGQGRVITSERTLKEVQVMDVSGCAPGAYMVRAVHSSGSYQRRLVVH